MSQAEFLRGVIRPRLPAFRSTSGIRRLLVSGLGIGALLAFAAPRAEAQGGGTTVSGRVTDAATGAPIQQARVLIAGTQVGTVTAENGRYSFRTTQSGNVTLEVSRIGFELKKVPLALSGPNVTADVTLSQAAFSLSAVVTTVTGQQRKVELANATATVNVAQKIAELPVANLSQVLTGRAAGVNVVSTGEPGVGSRIRIRGQSSISLSNEPVVIIDGVRVAAGSANSAIGVGGQSPSRLDDINPEEIESIEVVKGPSAATLYGTEAAAGVINITTKRGKAGRTTWNFYSEQGLTQDPRKGSYPLLYNAWGRSSTTGATIRCDLVFVAAGTCVKQDSVRSGNILNIDSLTPIDVGNRTQYGAQVSGGSDKVQYFVSGETEREDGVYRMPQGDINRLLAERGVTSLPQNQLRPQGLDRNNLRLNLNAQIAPKATIQLSSGYVNSNVRRMQNNDNANGLMVQAMGGNWDPAKKDSRGVPLPGMFSFPIGDVFSRTTTQELNRFINSATGRWDPTDWLNLRATFGYDYSLRDDLGINLFNQGIFAFPARNGSISSVRTSIAQGTVDLGGTATKQLTDWLGTKTSVGMQFIRNDFEQTGTTGENMPPGASTVTAAAIRNAFQSFDFTRTLGYYLEEQLSIRDRMFITAAVRRDAASAFGSEARSIYYPKLGASWLISEEGFMPRADWLQSLRLRGTYGASGQLPGPTDALRFYTPFPATLTGGVDAPSVTLSALGNSNLKPEYGAEIESGFDATMFDGKTNLVLTYYRKNTRDALVSRDLAPSLAGIASRFENIGNVRNSGFELEYTQRLIDRKSIYAEVLVNGSTNTNELLTLGEGVKPILTGAGSRITMRQQPGYPLYGMWGRTYTYKDANGDGILATTDMTYSDSAKYIGPSFPTREFQVMPTIELMDRKLRISAQLDRKWGMLKFNNTLRHMCQGGNSCRGRLDPTAPLEMQAAAIAANAGIFTGMYEDGSFTRLRELAVSYQLPASWAKAVKAQRWSVIFTGRNLAVWTPFTGLDPETTQSNTDNRGNEEFFSTPPMRTWTLRMNINY